MALALAPLAIAWGGGGITGAQALSPTPQAPAGATVAQQHWRERLEMWLRAVEAHQPGETDASTIRIGTWTEIDLAGLRADLFALLAIHVRETERTPFGVVPHGEMPSVSLPYKDAAFTLAGLRALLGVPENEDASRSLTRLLERGAILHADIGMRADPFYTGGVGCSPQASVLLLDGKTVGSGCVGIHWAQARALLDAVTGGATDEAWIRLWYHATIAYLLEHWNYADAEPQIEHAQRLFPKDPDILFEHGCFHETMASPIVESAEAASARSPKSRAAHLQEASELFRAAASLRPDFAEARIRRGHVLLELAKPGEAAEELKGTPAAARSPQLRYYAELLLGEAEQSRGSLDAAREHFESAAGIFPLAQSPRLALALEAVLRGDRPGAEDAMRPVLSIAGDDANRADPWWSYYRWQARGGNALLAELYTPFRKGDAR